VFRGACGKGFEEIDLFKLACPFEIIAGIGGVFSDDLFKGGFDTIGQFGRIEQSFKVWDRLGVG
jgi:hypothetical protein